MAEAQTKSRASGFRPIPQPEPGLKPDELVARAREIVPLLRAQQDESDKRGYYSPEAHEKMKQAGLYRVVQPKLFGGYEFDMATFFRCSMEISRGQPGAGWCYTLSTSHVVVACAHLSPEAQMEIFAGGDGDFRAPHKAPPSGTLKRVDGGYIVNGVWTYSSGIPYSTHVFGGVMVPDGDAIKWGHFIVPRDKVTMLDDWGGDHSLGMQASGSNSAKIDNVFVPDRNFIFADMLLSSDPGGAGTYGTDLHGNPIYLGVLGGVYHATFGAILTGSARATIEEYEQIMRKKSVPNNPQTMRIMDPDSQRVLGKAIQLTDSAEALTIACGHLYTEQCARWQRDKKPITAEDTLRLWGMAQEACFMACEAIEMMFRTAGSSPSNPGQKMGRYFRDIQMYITHPSSQPRVSSMLAQAYLGMGMNLFAERGRTPDAPKE